jgi:hypothetical protein
MAFAKRSIDPAVQERLRDMAGELRGLLYGAAACPEWGTKFREIEAEGMWVGLELARLLMEQAVAGQAQQMPAAALAVPGDEVVSAGTAATPLETEAGRVEWHQPRGYLKQGRKAFFPSAPGAGSGGR